MTLKSPRPKGDLRLGLLCPCGSRIHPWRHYLKLSTKLFYFALVAFSWRIYLPDNKNLLFHEGKMGSGEDGGMGEIMECVERRVSWEEGMRAGEEARKEESRKKERKKEGEGVVGEADA